MLLNFSKFFLYLSLASVLIVLPSTFFPFIGGKYYFFRVAVELALVFFILWAAFKARFGEVGSMVKELWQSPLFIAVSAFVAAYLLASFFAHDPSAAFWSNYERGEGAFQMLHYYVFFTLLLLLFASSADWRRAFKVSVAVAVLLILYGLFAQLDLGRGLLSFVSPYQSGAAPPTTWGRVVTARFQGTLGNPAYVAPYLMFSMFYLLYLWLGGSLSRSKGLARAVFSLGLVLVFLFFFILSQTRGAFLGLGAAAFTFVVGSIFLARERRKWFVSVLILMIAGGGLLMSYRKSDLIRRLPGGRLLELSFSDQTVQTRLWTWGSAWRGFKERPILGWGPENFSTVFDRHFDPRHFVPGRNTETWFDRAHSVFFDYLAETGLLGLLSYLAIFVVFYLQFSKKLVLGGGGAGESREITPSLTGKALLLAMPVGYLVQGLALFDVLPIYINLFLFLAFANFVFSKTNAAS